MCLWTHHAPCNIRCNWRLSFTGDAREDEDGVAVTEGLTMPEEGGADDEVGDQVRDGIGKE